MNGAGMVIGTSCTRSMFRNPSTCITHPHAWIWEAGYGLHDLQVVLDAGTRFTLTDVDQIGPAGQIAAIGTDTEDEPHLLLLTPHASSLDANALST
jgi:hypothetical protein